jgi:transposase
VGDHPIKRRCQSRTRAFAAIGMIGWPGVAAIPALAGLAPWTRQSGRWKGKSFIGGGRSSVRAALFMGALVAARHNPSLRTFKQRLIDAGKPKLVAIIAVARKLLTILNAVLRDKRPWRDVAQEHAHAKP